jgi:hypothetical protein
MKDDIYRKPLQGDNGLYVYVWNEHDLVQLQWNYSIEWSQGGGPRIWISSYTCWQRQTPSAPFHEVENLPFDIPMSEGLLSRLAEHAGKELYRRSVVVGSLRHVPQNFLSRAQEAATKGYNLKSLRELSQKECVDSILGEVRNSPAAQEWAKANPDEMPTAKSQSVQVSGASQDVARAQPFTPYDTPAVLAARARAKKMQPTAGLPGESVRAEEAIYLPVGVERGKQAYLVIGVPCAGKSTLSESRIAETHSMLVDPNTAEPMLTGYEGGVGAEAVHRESSAIACRVLRRAADAGLNIVHPILGRDIDGVRAMRDSLVDRGYDVHLLHVDLPIEKAAQRAVVRFEETGHFVDPWFILNGFGACPSGTMTNPEQADQYALAEADSREFWRQDLLDRQAAREARQNPGHPQVD